MSDRKRKVSSKHISQKILICEGSFRKKFRSKRDEWFMLIFNPNGVHVNSFSEHLILVRVKLLAHV